GPRPARRCRADPCPASRGGRGSACREYSLRRPSRSGRWRLRAYGFFTVGVRVALVRSQVLHMFVPRLSGGTFAIQAPRPVNVRAGTVFSRKPAVFSKTPKKTQPRTTEAVRGAVVRTAMASLHEVSRLVRQVQRHLRHDAERDG